MLTARGGPVRRRLPDLPLFPLLAAAYPVIFLFATNAAEQVTLAPLWAPLALAVGGAAIVLGVLTVAMRNSHQAALATTVLVVGFFGYGHAWNALGDRLESQRPLMAAWGLLVVIGLYAAWRFRGWARAATPALNLVAALLLLMNGWALTQAVVALGASDPIDDELTSVELEARGGDLPDVYYLVFDRYAGSTALSETYGYDNEPFLAALEDRGFRVARHAHANYTKTPDSLVSSLNMEFLDADALRAEQESGSDPKPIQRRVSQRLAVPAALKEIGYQYVHVANWWAPSATNVDADRVFRYDGQDEFSTVLAQTTLLRAINEPEAAPRDPYDWRVLYRHTLYGLDRLEQIPGLSRPKFVFAHLLLPHIPYVFDTDGSFTGRELVAERGDRESYLRQLVYTNSRLLGLVDRIIAESDEDAVIIVQADEGPYPAVYERTEATFQWRSATDAEMEEKFGILFAMRVPGADLDAEGFHDELTPVNAFRIIFNARFGTDLELRPDRVWAHEDVSRYFELFEITERLQR